MAEVDEIIRDQRREVLAEKGRRLYQKYCGTKGRGICAESFVCYLISRQEFQGVVDLLDHLEVQLLTLPIGDQRSMTERLIARIRSHLSNG